MSYEPIIVTEEFIKTNKLSLKSQEEIVAKIEEITADPQMFDFRTDIFISCLSYDNAKKYLIPEFIEKYEKGEEKWIFPSPLIKVAQDFVDYMAFAWGKAENQRSLSASRSINKLSAWLWVLDRSDLETLIDNDELYNPYGAPALIAVCEKLGIEVPNSLVEFSKIKCT